MSVHALHKETLAAIDHLLAKAGQHLESEEIKTLGSTCEYAANKYQDKTYSAKEKVFAHHMDVALILCDMHLDLETLQASILAGISTMENDKVDKNLATKFNENIANIVMGASKITAIRPMTNLTTQAENIRKMFLAMSSDIRILLLILGSRLHDMRIMAMPSGQQHKFARETMDIYAPLASRLGIDWMKRELEDKSFAHLHPEEYRSIKDQVDSTLMDRSTYVEEVKKILSRLLRKNDINDFKILGRPKHLYSIYRKLIVQKISLEKVYDKVAFRIIVQSKKECYEVLGLVHELWPPIAGRFKDFISTPKSNMYQSLHTSVIGPFGNFMEIQIRTEEMDQIAKEGVAAHWAYKEGKAISNKDARLFKWLKQLVQSLHEIKEPGEFLQTVKDELGRSDIYVLTPNGDIKELPLGSTSLDFAYAIHTEVGNKCCGTKVNGRLVPLRTPLQNSDVVEIMTSASQQPNRGWLTMVKTSRAKNRIRNWLRQDELNKSIELGREIAEKKLRRHELSLKKLIKTGHLKEILKKAGSNSLDDLLAKVGTGKITTERLSRILLPPELTETKEESPSLLLEKKRTSTKGKADAIIIDGIDNMLINISKCCLPMPGDDIIGFITAGRGVSVHKTDCPNLRNSDPARLIEVNWSTEVQAVHQAMVQVTAQDHKGLLVEICNSVSTDDANIINIEAHTNKDNLAMVKFMVEVKDLKHLGSILGNLRKIGGVLEAGRK